MRLITIAAAATLVALSGTGTLHGIDAFVANPSLLSSGRSRHNSFAHVQAMSALSAHESRLSCPRMGLFPKSGNGDSRRPFRRHLQVNPVATGAGREGLRRRFAFLRRTIDDDNGEVEEEEGNYEYEDEEEYDDGLDRNVTKRLKRSARVFRQVSWLSWWAQTILSTVAFIILLFSNAVTNRSARGNILGNGVALALGSLLASGASICWTWGYTLKARSWAKLGTLAEVDDAQIRMRNALKMGLYINVTGMLLALVGAEQIVGTLVAKVLYAQGFQPSVMVGTSGAAEVAQAQFRALDVFIVQANTNTLLSHFCSLAASLWLLARTPKLAKLAKGVY